jgi:hypothetical protein
MRLSTAGAILLAGSLAVGPAAAAPHRPIPAQCPADFGFRIEDGYGNCVDSDSGTVTKDMVMDADITIALHFTRAEMDTIYRAFVGLDVFDLPEPHPEINLPSDVVTTTSPSTWTRFEVRGRGLRKRFEWNDNDSFNLRRSTEAGHMFKAAQVVQRILDRRPEYARLPRPRGGYL